ncbi:MAG: Fe-S cluster assembly scaffold protein NifU [Candidatus Lokiarchaeota archaeon]|nr:Fe-S cluster assembly scaffold protein NifU [Candidatus Lokiarchaeota archaeon]
MKSTQYSEKVLDHFRNPRNVGVIENPDGYGKVGNPVCGDLMEIFIRVGKNKNDEDILTDIKFRTFGCGSAVATSSMITELAKGKTVSEAYKITRGDVADELGGLPPIKMHCSNLAADALQAAIRNYREGTRPDVEVITSCQIEIKVILGFDELLGKGAYKSVDNIQEFTDKRVLVVDNGDNSIELAIKLTEITGRVILVTSGKFLPGKKELQEALKKSDVKILYESELIEVKGIEDVEKVIIHDFDEDNNYELFVDSVINLDDR